MAFFVTPFFPFFIALFVARFHCLFVPLRVSLGVAAIVSVARSRRRQGRWGYRIRVRINLSRRIVISVGRGKIIGSRKEVRIHDDSTHYGKRGSDENESIGETRSGDND